MISVMIKAVIPIIPTAFRCIVISLFYHTPQIKQMSVRKIISLDKNIFPWETFLLSLYAWQKNKTEQRGTQLFFSSWS